MPRPACYGGSWGSPGILHPWDRGGPECRPVRIGHRQAPTQRVAHPAEAVGFATAGSTQLEMGGDRASPTLLQRPVEVGPDSRPVPVTAQHVSSTRLAGILFPSGIGPR